MPCNPDDTLSKEYRPWTAKEAMCLTLELVRYESRWTGDDLVEVLQELVEKLLAITDPAVSSFLQRAAVDPRFSFRYYPVSCYLHVRVNGQQVARGNVDTLNWTLAPQEEIDYALHP